MVKKFSKHTPDQIVAKLEKARLLKDQGATAGEICRQIGVSEPTLCRWRREYGQMSRSEAQELRALRDQNRRLKQLLAEAELDKAALKELAEGKF